MTVSQTQVFDAYKCPLCGLGFHLQQRSYRCDNRHCFDIAKEGYVNLLPVQQKGSREPGDSEAMLKSRRQFLQAGYYQELADALVAQCQQRLATNARVLDIGCGEGYYLAQLRAAMAEQALIGLDIAKAGVKLAAKRKLDAQLCVGSAFKLPYLDASIDLCYSIFAPIQLDEIKRVLKPQGLALFVGPGPEHLKELAQVIYDKTQDHDQSLSKVEQNEGFEILEHLQLKGELNVSQADILPLLMMTPYYWRAKEEQKQALARYNVLHTQYDFKVIIARVKT